jgi:hypothetical protein
MSGIQTLLLEVVEDVEVVEVVGLIFFRGMRVCSDLRVLPSLMMLLLGWFAAFAAGALGLDGSGSGGGGAGRWEGLSTFLREAGLRDEAVEASSSSSTMASLESAATVGAFLGRLDLALAGVGFMYETAWTVLGKVLPSGEMNVL